MLAAIPLIEYERAAVDDGKAHWISCSAGLLTCRPPAGPTPRQIGAPPAATMLPIASVKHRRGCSY